MNREGFRDPPWDAPLDVAVELQRVPETATQKGMFILAMVNETKKRGLTLESARDRYVPFQDYPLREHVQLLVETAHALFPETTLRHGLRRLGRGAYGKFIESTVGKVVFSTVTDVHSSIDGLLKGYSISMPWCGAKTLERGPSHAIVRFENMSYFLDSHHVGCIEGAIGAVGVKGRVRIRLESPTRGEFLAEW